MLQTIHRKSGTRRGIIPRLTASSLLCIPKEPQPTGTTRQVEVSTYLALTFGTLLSSQGTDASFKTVSRVSPDVCPFGVSDSIRWFLTGVRSASPARIP
ncbi:hypothetical protein DQ392_04470 [Streptomyces reniochalinae]|uniref:Uncharacterized protein n=1 Tax=Streptomyces reniochalinae TaxID=2250578 RepID=A0A367EYI2_9ACTN|nr:hypothetical protein DQ392_04470 [Streptomyces reniochalinae]